MTDREILEELVHLKKEMWYIEYKIQGLINELCEYRKVSREVKNNEH